MKNAIRNLALLLVASIVGALIVEVIVRAAVPQILFHPRRDIWLPDSTFGHRHVANADAETNVYDEHVHFATDDRGYRIDSKSPPLDCDPAVHILMLGDSFLEGMKVEEEETIPALTRQALERDHDICAVIDNSGVSGWNPNHYYLEARRALDARPYRAGVVFVYIGNDVIESEAGAYPPQLHTPHRNFRLPRSLRGGELVDAVINPINDVLRSRSHAYVFARDRIRARARRNRTKESFPRIYRRDQADAPFWSVTASVCAKILAHFDERGVPVLFAFIPVFSQVFTENFDRYVRECGFAADAVDVTQPNRLLARELARRGIRVVDPLDDMRRMGPRAAAFYGPDAHFSAEGNVFMTRFIMPELLRMLGNTSASDRTD